MHADATRGDIESARHKKLRWRGAGVWFLLVLAMALLTALRWPQQWLQTDLISLLPDTEQNVEIHAANARVDAALQRETVWLVGAATAQDAVNGARDIARSLQDSKMFERVDVQWQGNGSQAVFKRLFESRWQLLTRADAQLLGTNPDAFFAQRLNLLYSPAGAMLTQQFSADPLGLFARYLQDVLPQRGDLIDGTPVFQQTQNGSTEYFALIRATVADHGASADSQLMQLWQKLQQHLQQKPQQEQSQQAVDAKRLQLLATGVPFYSAYGSDSAKREINRIGSASMILIVVLLLLVFRSPRPLLLSMFVVFVGTAGGIAGCILLLGYVHVVTLVFGAAITGVSVDYAIHYLCDSLRPNWNPVDGMKHMFAGLTLGMLTSVLAFALLAVAPFPGVRQISVFAAAGLLSSWTTTVLLLPLLARKSKSRAIPSDHFQRPAKHWRYLAIIILLALAPGLLKLHPVDDIRLFYAAPTQLQQDAERIRAIMPTGIDSRFFLVTAPNVEAVLQAQEQLMEQLDGLIARQALGGYQASAATIPSLARQQHNQTLIRDIADSGKLVQFLRQLGFNREAEAALLAEIHKPFSPLAPDASLEFDPIAPVLRPVCNDNGCSAIVALRDIRDIKAVSALASAQVSFVGTQVQWVDRVDALSSVMQHYRLLAAIALLVALLVAVAVVSVYAGIKEGLLLGSIPALGMLVSLATIGYLGELFSVFNLLALLLVVGVGMDYAIFYRLSEPDGRGITALALVLDVATTILAMGMLSFSETPVIRAFGLTLVPGLLAAFFLAFLLPPKSNNHSAHEPDVSASSAGN
ncbi:MAG: MMPL family transporter [Spongiibacteraceae bacterium]